MLPLGVTCLKIVESSRLNFFNAAYCSYFKTIRFTFSFRLKYDSLARKRASKSNAALLCLHFHQFKQAVFITGVYMENIFRFMYERNRRSPVGVDSDRHTHTQRDKERERKRERGKEGERERKIKSCFLFV